MAPIFSTESSWTSPDWTCAKQFHADDVLPNLWLVGQPTSPYRILKNILTIMPMCSNTLWRAWLQVPSSWGQVYQDDGRHPLPLLSCATMPARKILLRQCWTTEEVSSGQWGCIHLPIFSCSMPTGTVITRSMNI